MILELQFPPSMQLKKLGAHMARPRRQHGWLSAEKGKWVAHWFAYVRLDNGKEVRRRRDRVLDLKSKMPRWRAEERLQELVSADPCTFSALPDPNTKLRWFWENRFLPLAQARWKRSTLASFPYLVERHILDKFGDLPLQKLSQFEFQDHLNKLGNSHSRSLVLHVRKLFRQILGEAVEQQYVQRNIALKLSLPKRMRKPSNRFLSLEEIAVLDRDLPSRERLIFRLLALLGLRPGELFARRWRDWLGDRFLIEDAVYRGQIDDPKTENSKGFVWLPRILQQNLADYKITCRCAEPDDFIFRAEHGKSGRPMDTHNYLRRVFKPACCALGVKGVTHQSLRRTCSTYMLDIPQANLKDVQAHLRHSSAETTLQIYVQEIPESVRLTVEQMADRMFPRNVELTAETDTKLH